MVIGSAFCRADLALACDTAHRLQLRFPSSIGSPGRRASPAPGLLLDDQIPIFVQLCPPARRDYGRRGGLLDQTRPWESLSGMKLGSPPDAGAQEPARLEVDRPHAGARRRNLSARGAAAG